MTSGVSRQIGLTTGFCGVLHRLWHVVGLLSTSSCVLSISSASSNSKHPLAACFEKLLSSLCFFGIGIHVSICVLCCSCCCSCCCCTGCSPSLCLVVANAAESLRLYVTSVGGHGKCSFSSTTFSSFCSSCSAVLSLTVLSFSFVVVSSPLLALSSFILLTLAALVLTSGGPCCLLLSFALSNLCLRRSYAELRAWKGRVPLCSWAFSAAANPSSSLSADRLSCSRALPTSSLPRLALPPVSILCVLSSPACFSQAARSSSTFLFFSSENQE